MAKKVKSFNVDEAAYNSMVALLKEYDTEASISSILDKCLKELLNYFKTMEAELRDSDDRKEIIQFIIDKKAGSVLIPTPDKETPGEGDPLRGNPLMATKALEPQIYEGMTVTDLSEDAGQMELPEIEESELDEEVQYWRDEYEANKKNLSRAFVKFLRSGKYILSTDRKFLIEKETGKRFVDLATNYIVEIVTGASEK